MYKIGNKYWKVGTNGMVYLNNYIKDINYLDKWAEIELNEEFIIINNIQKLNYKSRATARQNVESWIAMGFISKVTNNFYKKCIEPFSKSQLIEYSTLNIFLPTNDKSTKKYRDSIIVNCLYLDGKINPLQKFYLTKTRGTLELEDLKESAGKFEEKILENKLTKKILEYFYEQNND